MIWAVLPAKNFDQAKERLSPALSAPERRDLFRAMFEDVLAALADAPSLAGVMVVTRDAEAIAITRPYGARILHEDANNGQTAAIEFAAATLANEGAGGMLTMPGDVPLATGAEVEQVLASHGDHEGARMTIVPAHDERGSNCIVCSPPGLIPFQFGNDSFRPHLAATQDRGVTPNIIKFPGIGLDIDRPEDLLALLTRVEQTGETGRAVTYLYDSGVARRLEQEANRASSA
ncbi:MAG: 2-phospho-L-lactate guanylyltransferase [Rhodospirillaceae bacterium]|nr:2-phospho-L-lactate guanylyltransferase [Rhodospirillaceae bacterium]